MIREYSEEQMMRIWRIRAGMLVADCGCVVGRSDGFDVEELLRTDLRRWYAGLLRHAPADLLPIENLSSEAELIIGDNYCARIELPERGVRVLGLSIEGMDREIVDFHRPGSYYDLVYKSETARKYATEPVAVVSGRTIDLLGYKGGELKSLRMVAVPADGKFRFDDSLLPALMEENL